MKAVWDTVKSVAGKVGSAVKNFVTPGAVKQARKKPVGNKGSLAKTNQHARLYRRRWHRCVDATVKVLRNIVDQTTSR